MYGVTLGLLIIVGLHSAEKLLFQDTDASYAIYYLEKKDKVQRLKIPHTGEALLYSRFSIWRVEKLPTLFHIIFEVDIIGSFISFKGKT